MYFYKEGYTEEEFEEVYGMKPYIEMEGQKLYRTDLIVFPNGNIDINFQLRRLQQALEDGEDTTHFFETERILGALLYKMLLNYWKARENMI